MIVFTGTARDCLALEKEKNKRARKYTYKAMAVQPRDNHWQVCRYDKG